MHTISRCQAFLPLLAPGLRGERLGVMGLQSRLITTCVILFFLSLGTLVTPTIAQEQPVDTETVPLERRPYDVRMLVAFDGATFDDVSTQTVLNEFDQSVQRCVGNMWSVKTLKIDWLGPVSPRGLERLDRASLIKQYPGDTADVWFVACVESVTAGMRVSVRACQPEIQLDTAVVSVDVMDRREIPVTILRLCRDLIRPMGLVEQATKQSVRIRLRAGELTPPDPSFVQLKRDDLLLPMFAFRDKNKVIERLQSIPWTYVAVEETDGSTIQGAIRSGLRMALSGKKRGRVDTIVVALRPQYSSTQIELLTQTKPQLPLVAHRIEVRSSNSNQGSKSDGADADPDANLLNELLTDRRGLIRIPVERDHPLVWLFAYSGDHLLVRVPCVPGITPTLRLEVPNDAARLTAEADLQMLQGEVIDAVAFRNTAIATIRAASKKDDWETVNKKLDLLRRHQDAGALNDRLIAVRVAGTEAAKARKDRAAEVRINRICDDTATLIKAHLDNEKVRLLIEEMEILQKAEKSEARPQPDAPARQGK